MNTIKKTFEIEASPVIMARFERLLALFHYNSRFGHSGTFAMPLDGDGPEKMTVSPKPGYAHEVDLCGGIGGDVEIALDRGFTAKKLQDFKSFYFVRTAAALYKDDEMQKAIPSRDRD